jgi:hypothetical protein
MRCPACDQLNSVDARFCTGCGAPLALTTWTQQPAPAATPFAAVPYGPPQLLPRAPAAISAPPAYPLGQGQPGPASAPYGYAPAPAPGTMPSMVNNVTVTQTAPPPPATPSAPVAPPVPAVATGHAGGLGTLLRALYFLGSGLALGVVWTAAVQAATAPYSNQPWAIPLAIALTILLLLLNIVVLNRLARRR